MPPLKIESKIRASIASVFSVLPAKAADGAKEQLLKQFLDNKTSGDMLQIKWVEFQDTGKVVRSGCTSLNDLSTEFYSDTHVDGDIKLLHQRAKNHEAQIGTIEKLTGKEAFIWFISLPQAYYQDNKADYFKALIINETVFYHTLESFNSDANLTKSEKRIIFQLTCGISVSEAATIDHVNVETKRSQLKSTFNKLQCINQVSLIRLALSQLTYLSSLTLLQNAHREGSRTAELFAYNYFPDTINYSQRQLSNGNVLRFFECGPLDGKPVILIHGLMFPLILTSCHDCLKKHNIRLIMPIRHGYLENGSTTKLYRKDHELKQSIEDITCFIQQHFTDPVPVIGHAFGSAITIKLASENPGLFSQIICASLTMSKPQVYHSKIVYGFLYGLNQLLSKPGVFRMIIWQFRKYFASIGNIKPIIEKMFVSVNDDLTLLNKKIGNQPAYSWFRDNFRSSIIGIAEDFAFTMHNANFNINKIKAPILLIHGRQDTITSEKTINDLTQKNTNCEIFYIEGGGFLAYGTHNDIFWEKIAKKLQLNESNTSQSKTKIEHQNDALISPKTS